MKRWLGGAALALVLGALAFEGWVRTAPLPPLGSPTSQVVADRDGVPLRIFLARDDRWRLPVSPARVDPGYLAQLIAYEDKRFYSHAGVDPLALLRAARDSALAGRVVSGGSTLTMQTARLLDGGGTGRLSGKFRQMRLALALERRLSKAEILQIYLTRAPFGGNLEGVRAASFSYFGKDAHRLSPAEAALLVALPQAPESRRPDRSPAAARKARDAVLARSAASGALAPDLLPRALRADVPRQRMPFPAHAWHAAAAAHAIDPDSPVHRLDLSAGPQVALESRLERLAPTLPPGASAALMVREVDTGRIVARVGAALPGQGTRGGFIDMTQVLRSPGSALKPFIYALAFDAGIAHPETILSDRPTDFGGYAPRNFDGGFLGPVSAREALQLSLNVPAVAVLDQVGASRLMAFLRQSGARPETPGGGAPGLSAALGGLGITLEDLTGSYTVLASGGGHLLSPAAAWYVSDILRGAPAPESGQGGAIAFKTGTSYGHRDGWALGYDGAHVVGVWIGRPDGGAVPGLTGLTHAAPVLFQAMDRLAPERAPLAGPPPGALTVALDALPRQMQRLGPVQASGQPEAETFRIAYPPSGARLSLGSGGMLVAKLAEGRPPFTWMIDGRVVAADPTARSFSWPMEERGFVTITALDRTGAAARTTIEVLTD
ncbi:penicillin-binding protein 1C [Oceanibium sediminis]|uniref:penicillin-binding protein 1C n=1 Tax=Oceanibium sediminis TaxID=2026339 RepID=UPI000DD38744|nr:penicillin-binding protein 1C [Oceanibium sediminis]